LVPILRRTLEIAPSKSSVSNHPGIYHGDTVALFFGSRSNSAELAEPEIAGERSNSMQENRGSADTTPIQDSTHMLRLRLQCAIALQPGPVKNLHGSNLDFCGPLR
jgi:hypothetical protein